jgi:hypothetical protein
MNTRDKDLAAFEEYLFSFMNDETPGMPLNNDEVVAILENYAPLEEPAAEEKEQIIKIMKAAHERRKYVKMQIQNLNRIHSVGELFHLFCEWRDVPSAWLARLLNLTEEQFEAYKKDKVSPLELGKERILNFAALAGISIQEMLGILEKTVKLSNLKPTTNLAAAHTRVYKEASASELSTVRESAMKELVLALDEPEEIVISKDDWKTFRQELLQESAEANSGFDIKDHCFTIRDRSRRNFANVLLQQI